MRLRQLLPTIIYASALTIAHAQYAGFDEPAFWPSQIETTGTLLDHETVEGNSKSIKQGTRGLLQRIESGKLLVDFGRHGLHWLEPRETNIADLYGPNQRDSEALEYPNLTSQIGNKMVRFVGRDATHILISENAETEYYISIYVGQMDQDTALILQYLDRLQPQLGLEHPQIRCVVFAGADRWYGYFMTAFNRLAIIIPHMRLSYAAAIHQEPAALPSLVVADAYGRIIHRSGQLQLNRRTSLNTRQTTRAKIQYRQLEPVAQAFNDALAAIEADPIRAR